VKLIPKLIGLYGKAGSGKDTTADFIINNFKHHYTLAFADPLKEAAAVAFGIPLDHFYSRELKEMAHPNWDISPRAIAQFVGTEMFRDNIGKLLPRVSDDFWIYRAKLRLMNLYVPEDEGEFEDGDTVVISDVRFQNEYDWIIANDGVIIHLTRPSADGTVGIPGHASESDINLHDKERTFTCVNEGTIPELHRKIANIIVSLNY
jgi:hypothetical protein